MYVSVLRLAIAAVKLAAVAYKHDCDIYDSVIHTYMFLSAVCYIFYGVCIIGLRIICEGFVRVSDTKKLVLTSNQILFGQGMRVCVSSLISHHQSSSVYWFYSSCTQTNTMQKNSNRPDFDTIRKEKLSGDGGVL